jgi:hypothetical protein
MPFQPLQFSNVKSVSTPTLSSDFYALLIRKQKEINQKVTEHGLRSEDRELKAQAEIQKRQQELRQANETKERKEEEDKKWQVFCKELASFLRSKRKQSTIQLVGEAGEEDQNDDILDAVLSQMSNRRLEASKRPEYAARFQDGSIQSLLYTLLVTDLEAIAQIYGRYGFSTTPALAAHIQSIKRLEQTIRATITQVRSTKKREQAKFRPELESLLNQPLLATLPPSIIHDLENAYEGTSQKRVLGSGSETGSIFVQVFPYIAKQKLKFESLDLDTIVFSPEEESALQAIEAVIREPSRYVADPSIATNSSSQAKISMLQIIRLAQEISNIFNVFPRGSTNLSSACHKVQSCILEVVRNDNKSRGVDSSGFHATLICAIFRALPNSGHRKSWSFALQSYFLSLPVVIPDLSDQGTSIDDQLATIRLYSSILAYQIPSGNDLTAVGCSTVSPLPISLAWQWLHRISQQLYVLVAHRRASSDASSAAAAFDIDLIPSPNIALLLNAFLMRTGHALSIFYQDQFLQFLKTFQQELLSSGSAAHLVMKGFEEVKTRLQNIISKHGATPPMYYLHQDPYILDAFFQQQQSIVGLEAELVEVEKDRTGPFMQRVKALQIDRMRAVFNRMGATEQSRDASIKQLMEKIVLASKDSPEMLRYTLFKVVQNVINDCQDTNFNEMEESHPLKLARVVSSVGKDISQLADIFKTDFMRACPLLIPRLISEGINENENLISLGFVLNKSTNVMENSEKWLARMGKLLATAVVLAIQPEQLVFTLHTLWTLLARVTNQTLRMPSNPPFYIPTIYEIILRIAGDTLFRKFGVPFMQLLTIIQSQVVPKFFDTNIPKLQSLIVFLDKFIKSNGRDFLGFFK